MPEGAIGAAKLSELPRQVETFYDQFSSRWVEDLVQGNERIAQQLSFFSKAIPSAINSVLVVGIGSGYSSYFIASEIAPNARVKALDISSQALRLASTLFSHPRIEYRKLDVLREPVHGEWDGIVLPDIYEHIPIASRPELHVKLKHLLSANGKIFLTVPSPGKQASLHRSGKGMQIVDETVTLQDLILMANEVGGSITYFNMVSVWETNDYMHAVIERGGDRVRPIAEVDKTSLKGWPRKELWTRGLDFLGNRLQIFKLHQAVKRRRLRASLQLDH